MMGKKHRRSSGKPFYKKWWGISLLLLFFAPVGIFLMWKYWKGGSNTVKGIISGVMGLFFVICLLPGGEPEPEPSPPAAGTSISASVSAVSETSEESVEPETSKPEKEPSKPSSSVSSSSAASESSSVSGEAAKSSAPAGTKNVVYWGNTGTKYHINPDCGSFNDTTPNSGTISQAKALGRSSWCKMCSDGWTDKRLEADGNPYAK